MTDPLPSPVRTVIMGAAGRDFHNFNVVYRDDPRTEVVAFTAAQIPDIAGRRYPPALAGPRYPAGIPIVDEGTLAELCAQHEVGRVVFAYSDVRHEDVMHRASVALAAGADFELLGPRRTMLRSTRPVIAVCAVRTGCGKSQTTRWLSRRIRDRGSRAAVLRHPMPYGDLERQAVQRFGSRADLDAADCTVEEREEYEPHLAIGNPVFAGVDYAAILGRAEAEADVILWDGGNNDFPFLVPDLTIALVDPFRPGDETGYHPGETVLRMADVVVVAKADAAPEAGVQAVAEAARRCNPRAEVFLGASPVVATPSGAMRGRRVLVVEDGPTVTHGGMPYGAGYVAAGREGAADIVDPRGAASGEIAEVFARHRHIGPVLPAMGYGRRQLAALEATIRAVDADVVAVATPCDLAALIAIDRPVVRITYEFAEWDDGGLGRLVDAFLDRALPPGGQSQ